MSPAVRPPYDRRLWLAMLALLALSQVAEIYRPELETAISQFAILNRTQITTAVLLSLLAVLFMIVDNLRLIVAVAVLRAVLQVVSLALILIYVGVFILPSVELITLSSHLPEAFPGVPSLETAMAVFLVTQLATRETDRLTSWRFFMVFGLTAYGVYELFVVNDTVLNLTHGSGMGPMTILFFAAFLFDFWRHARDGRLEANWRLGFFPAVFVFLLLSWFVNVPKPDNLVSYLLTVAVFGTVLAGIRATLMYGYDNAKLAIVHKAQADRITRQNEDLALIVSSLSHDLKSPVRNVRTLVTMRHALKAERGMSDGDVDQEQIKSLKRIEDLSTSFIRYIRSRDEELETKPVRIAALLRQVSAGFAGRVEINVEGDGAAVLLGDRGALIRVFENLLENSIQHGRAEQPEAVFVVDKAGDRVRIRYEDNGVGIPSAIRERLFKPFETQEPKHRSGASGLGLAIVERLTGRMNGTIRIDDPVRLSGASFEMLFPSGDVQ